MLSFTPISVLFTAIGVLGVVNSINIIDELNGLAGGVVMLSARNPSVSPWAPLLACGYPIIEVVFSMLRRSVRTKQIGHPDRLHLHTLVWARVTKKHLSARPPVVQNAATLPFILAYAAIPAGLSVLFKTNTLALMLSLLFCVILYTFIYFRLVKFRWALPKFT